MKHLHLPIALVLFLNITIRQTKVCQKMYSIQCYYATLYKKP